MHTILCFAIVAWCSIALGDGPRDASLRFKSGQNVGSAVAVDLEAVEPGSVGWALTAKHVLAGRDVPVVLHSFDWSEDGEPLRYHAWPAKVTHVSDQDDLCLLAVFPCESDGVWRPAKLAPASYRYNVADPLASFGCAFGRDPDRLECLPVAHRSTVSVDKDNRLGRSGGPLFDSKGRIVGIASTRTVGQWTTETVNVVGRDERPLTLPASSDFVPIDRIWSLWKEPTSFKDEAAADLVTLIGRIVEKDGRFELVVPNVGRYDLDAALKDEDAIDHADLRAMAVNPSVSVQGVYREGGTIVPRSLSVALEPFEQQMIDEANRYRAKHGLRALVADMGLMATARRHSQAMASRRSMYHGGTSGWSGENVAWNQRDPVAVTLTWYNSPGHRANMLSSRFTKIGVGGVNRFWCQQFK